MVKGTVSLVNASQDRSTPEGLLLELKSLAEGPVSLSAVTDAPGKNLHSVFSVKKRCSPAPNT